MTEILNLYYSRHGSVRELSRHIAAGVESEDNCIAKLRTAPPVSTVCEAIESNIPDEGDPYVSLDDLSTCNDLALGSPTHFGNMVAPLKYFLDQTAPQWLSSALKGKPAAVFISTSSMHGGQASTLLAMMIPLFHHGMILTGIPFPGFPLPVTTSGGTPYGASHVAGGDNTHPVSQDEKQVCAILGKRLATFSKKLQSH